MRNGWWQWALIDPEDRLIAVAWTKPEVIDELVCRLESTRAAHWAKFKRQGWRLARVWIEEEK